MLYSQSYPAIMAMRLFEQAYLKGRRQQFWSIFTRRPWRLLDLNDIASLVKVDGRHYAGVQTVQVREIQGSVSRSREFTNRFLPVQMHTRERWTSIAAAMLRDIGMPIIELVRVGEVYYVLDGHHRISVARSFGALEMEAEVTVWETSRLAPPKELTPPEGVEPTPPDVLDKAM